MSQTVVLHFLYYLDPLAFFFFFFNDTATTEIYTLSLHDALPISWAAASRRSASPASCHGSATRNPTNWNTARTASRSTSTRSEEHTSELRHQIISYAVFCLKKKKQHIQIKELVHYK